MEIHDKYISLIDKVGDCKCEMTNTPLCENCKKNYTEALALAKKYCDPHTGWSNQLILSLPPSNK